VRIGPDVFLLRPAALTARFATGGRGEPAGRVGPGSTERADIRLLTELFRRLLGEPEEGGSGGPALHRRTGGVSDSEPEVVGNFILSQTASG